MKIGQIVRIKLASPIAEQWGLDIGATGEVLCSYQGKSGLDDTANRIDVRFGEGMIVWAAPAQEFEPINAVSEAAPNAAS